MRVEPENLSLQPVTERSIELLKTLNSAIFPVSYQDKFYQQVLATDAGYTHLAFLDGILAGAVCCRLERVPPEPEQFKLYIMTLGVLSAYRRLHIGSIMLKKILATAEEDPRVLDVQLHVQTNNDEAIGFYKKHGFKIVEEVKEYYKRIDPPDAYLLLYKLHVDAGKD